MAWTPPQDEEVFTPPADELFTPPAGDEVIGAPAPAAPEQPPMYQQIMDKVKGYLGGPVSAVKNYFATPLSQRAVGAAGASIGEAAGGAALGPAGAAVGAGIGDYLQKNPEQYTQAVNATEAPARAIRSAVQPAVDAAGAALSPISPLPGAVTRGAVNLAADTAASYLTPTGALLGAVPTPRVAAAPRQVTEIGAKAAKMGIPLTPAQATGSKPLGALEAIAEKFPTSAGTMSGFQKGQAQAINKVKEGLIGGAQGDEALGSAIKEEIGVTMQKTRDVRDKAYQALENVVPKDAVVMTDNLATAADDIMKDQFQRIPEQQDKELMKEVMGLIKIREQGLSWAGLKATREALSQQKQKHINDGLYPTYKKLLQGLDKDIQTFSDEAGGAVKETLDFANAIHGNYKEALVKNKDVKRILAAKPEKVVDIIFQPGEVAAIRKVKDIAGDSYAALENKMVERLFEGAGPNTPPGQALARNMYKMGDETLNVALSRERVQKLKDFAKVTANIKASDVIAGNPSGSGSSATVAIGLGGWIVAHPVTGIPVAIAAPVMAKMYLNPLTRALVRKAFEASTNGGIKATQAAGRLALAATSFQEKEKKAK